MATIIHFDVGADDVERAKTFYEKLFNWKIERMPGPGNYYLVSTDDLCGHPGVGGGIAEREPGRAAGIINYIGVESIGSTLKQVVELGGKVVRPAQPVPGYGSLAVCEDSEGNVFGVFEEAG